MRISWWIISVALLLAACSPEYNWRTVQMADAAVEQIFPASPHEEQVPMSKTDSSLHYSVASAKVADALFMATWIPVLVDQSATDMYEHVVNGILQRAGDRRLLKPERGQVFQIQTQSASQPMRTDLRLLSYETGLLQLSVSAPAGALFPDEAATLFLNYAH